MATEPTQWHWQNKWEKDKSDSAYNGAVGCLLDENDNEVLWYGMDGEERIYCPAEEHAALIAAAPALLVACQASVIVINEILGALVAICTAAKLPPFPPPPIQGVKDAIINAGGVVYENAKHYQATIAAAESET